MTCSTEHEEKVLQIYLAAVNNRNRDRDKQNSFANR